MFHYPTLYWKIFYYVSQLVDLDFFHQQHELHSLKLTAKAPENGWLEYDSFLLGGAYFQGEHVSFREGKNRLFLFPSRHCHRMAARSSWPSFGVWHWSWVLVHRSWVDATVRLRQSAGGAGRREGFAKNTTLPETNSFAPLTIGWNRPKKREFIFQPINFQGLG